MGWNPLKKKQEIPLWNDVGEGSFVYYVHSYYADCPSDIVCGVSDYGIDIPGLVAKKIYLGHSFILKKR